MSAGLDGDGIGGIIVGAQADDDGDNDRGVVWMLFLEPDGTVKSHEKTTSHRVWLRLHEDHD